MSKPSETQVCLRQARYEAFMDWRMPVIIASIPALLEIALILFLIGADIFLWTLNGIVFGVCTFAIAILIIMAFITTILPVFCPRCPYKSPAGWACLLTWQATVRLYRRSTILVHVIVKWVARTGPTTNASKIANIPNWTDWRERDLALMRWQLSADSVPEPRIYSRNRYSRALYDAETHTMTGCSQTLRRALKWIVGISQDTRILRGIEESTPNAPADWSPFSWMVLPLHTACDVLGIPIQHLVPPKDKSIWMDAENPSLLVTAKDRLGMSVDFQVQQNNESAVNYEWEHGGDVSPSMAIQISHCIVRSLSVALDDHRLLIVMNEYGKQGVYYLHAAVALGSVLIRLAAVSERRTSDQLSSVVTQYAQVLDKLIRDPSISARLSPLRFPLYWCICYCERPLNRKFLFPAEDAPKRTRTALKYPALDPAVWCAAECQFFVTLSADALDGGLRRDYETLASRRASLITPLFNRMEQCAKRCLQVREWSWLRWDLLWWSCLYLELLSWSTLWC